MKVELTRGIIWDKLAREAGEVLELSEVDGFTLIDKGKAKLYREPAIKTVNRSIGLENSSQQIETVAEKPKRRTYRKNSL
jgi:hypothetical protein